MIRSLAAFSVLYVVGTVVAVIAALAVMNHLDGRLIRY